MRGLLFLIVLFSMISLSTPPPPPQPIAVLQNTGLLCEGQQDCMEQIKEDWCKYSMITCLMGQCRVAPIRVCLPDERGNASAPCMRKNHKCEVKPCNIDSDCGRLLQFCDGYDKCVNNLCQFYYRPNNCIQQYTTCIKSENLCSPPFSSINIDTQTIRIQTNSTNSTEPPTPAPTDLPINFWLWWIIIFSGLAFATLFVVIVATLVRSAPISYVPNNRGDALLVY